MNDINRPVSTDEIAMVIGKSKATVERMANNSGWKFTEEASKGRYKKRVYALNAIDATIALKVRAYRMQLRKEQELHHEAINTQAAENNAGTAGRDIATHRVDKDAAVAVDDIHGGKQLSTAKAMESQAVSGKSNERRHRRGAVTAGGNGAGTSGQKVGHVESDGKGSAGNQCLDVGAKSGHTESTASHYPAKQAHTALADLTTVQRNIHSARKNLVECIQAGTGSLDSRIAFLNAAYAEGSLPALLVTAYAEAWEKRRDNAVLNKKTYENWCNGFKERGHYAPLKKQKDTSEKIWHQMARELFGRPQKPSMRSIERDMKKALGTLAPEYEALRFFIKELESQKEGLKGRHKGSALWAKLFYQHRTSEGLVPASLAHADGWNTHFTAPHHVTGEFVTYEVWHYHDVATRYVTTPAIGYTENADVILKGIENFVRELGVPATVQTDSTAIVKKSERFTKAAHSLEERLGMTWVHPVKVGNSRANGIAENFNSSWLDMRSKELATYQNPKSMDSFTFKNIRKLTTHMVKAANAGHVELREQKKREIEKIGKGLVFESHQQACEWIVAICNEFNDRPHSSLKNVLDPVTGKPRHQTPREALNEFINWGWEPVALDEQELIDAFRTHVKVKVRLETVSPWGGMRYANAEHLGHYEGKEVVVSYDATDNRTVWVQKLNGAFICEADLVGATGYMSENAAKAADEKRFQASMRRNEITRLQKIARHEGNTVEGEVLRRIEVIPQEVLAPLVRVPAAAKPVEEELTPVLIRPDVSKQEPEERPMSYEESVMLLYNKNKGQ